MLKQCFDLHNAKDSLYTRIGPAQGFPGSSKKTQSARTVQRDSQQKRPCTQVAVILFAQSLRDGVQT